jgi:hypothetical protein
MMENIIIWNCDDSNISPNEVSVHLTYGASFVNVGDAGLSCLQYHQDSKIIENVQNSLKVINCKLNSMWCGPSIVLLEDIAGRVFTLGFNDDRETDLPGQRIPRLLTSTIAISMVAVGYSHFLILDSNGRIHSAGNGESGQLGIGQRVVWSEELMLVMLPHEEKGKEISVGSLHSAIVTHSGNLYTFGSGSMYRLGHGTENDCLLPTLVEDLQGVGELLPNGKFSGVSSCCCGIWHTVAISKGTCDVFGWGWNRHGQLGNSSVECVYFVPSLIRSFDDLYSNSNIIGVSCGTYHTAIWTSAGECFVM